jgi:hypothetical protein
MEEFRKVSVSVTLVPVIYPVVKNVETVVIELLLVLLLAFP